MKKRNDDSQSGVVTLVSSRAAVYRSSPVPHRSNVPGGMNTNSSCRRCTLRRERHQTELDCKASEREQRQQTKAPPRTRRFKRRKRKSNDESREVLPVSIRPSVRTASRPQATTTTHACTHLPQAAATHRRSKSYSRRCSLPDANPRIRLTVCATPFRIPSTNGRRGRSQMNTRPVSLIAVSLMHPTRRSWKKAG